MISLTSSSAMTTMPSHRALLPVAPISFDAPSELPGFSLDSSFEFNSIPDFTGFWLSSFDAVSFAAYDDEEFDDDDEFDEEEEFDDEEFDDDDDYFDDDDELFDDEFDEDEFDDEEFDDEDDFDDEFDDEDEFDDDDE